MSYSTFIPRRYSNFRCWLWGFDSCRLAEHLLHCGARMGNLLSGQFHGVDLTLVNLRPLVEHPQLPVRLHPMRKLQHGCRREWGKWRQHVWISVWKRNQSHLTSSRILGVSIVSIYRIHCNSSILRSTTTYCNRRWHFRLRAYMHVVVAVHVTWSVNSSHFWFRTHDL